MTSCRPCPARVLLLLAAALAACTPLPKFDSPQTLQVSKDYPSILPLDQVVTVGGDAVIAETDPAALQARAAALQGRAAALEADGPDPATRARLEAAIAADAP